MSYRLERFGRRAVDVFQNYGLVALARKGFARLHRLIHVKERYLIFRHELQGDLDDPRVRNVAVTAICSREEMDDLPEKARQPLELIWHRLQTHLSMGGMFFCVLIDGSLASQIWVSTGPRSKVDPISPFVDYAGQAYLAAGETLPEFRGRGLFTCVLAKICESLRSKGFLRAIATVSPGNAASIAGLVRTGFHLLGEGELSEWFGVSFWRESSGVEEKGR